MSSTGQVVRDGAGEKEAIKVLRRSFNHGADGIDTPTPNPYQPPRADLSERDRNSPTEISFQVKARLRRHALEQYLLHWHPKRLLFSSLAMIFICGACLFFSVRHGLAAFVPTMIAVMVVPAVIYTLLVRRTRNRIKERLVDFGLASEEMMTLRMEGGQLQLVNSLGTYRWSFEQLQIYQTGRGLLICLEPLLFAFVPKKSDFQGESYQHFVNMINSRIFG